MRSRPHFHNARGEPVSGTFIPPPAAVAAATDVDGDKTLADKLGVQGIRTPAALLSLPGTPHFDVDTARPAGHYQIGEVLGEGGMGRVVAARDEHLGRVVAMKTLHPDHEGNETYAQALVFEAWIAGRLEHPNIVPVYELGTLPDGTPYYTMKRVEGRSLQEVLSGLRDQRPMFVDKYTLPKLLQYFRGICMAIDYAHDRGVIHRDLKPDNVLLGYYGEVQILDWGVARVLPRQGLPGYFAGREEQPGSVVGTPHYMSPEQARGDTLLVDARSDIYSLGVILYQLLTHTLPHEHSDTVRQVDALLSEPIIPPRERAPHLKIPEDLERICMRALSPIRDARYFRVREMWNEIEAWMEGERERTRLKEMAAAQTEAAHRIVATYYDRSARLSESQTRMRHGEMGARPIDPLPVKKAQWDLKLQTQAEKMVVARLFAEAVLGYQRALAFTPDHKPALSALAKLYQHRADVARLRNDTAEQIHYSDLARAIAPPSPDARGRLTVRTYPEGATVELFELSGARVDSFDQDRSPVVEALVRPGSYFVSVTMPGYRHRRDAVVIEGGLHEEILINLIPWDSSLPLAARGDDLFVMRDAFLTTVATGRLGNLMVTGEAGVGKRKLLDEFSAWLEELPQLVAYGAARVEPIHAHVPFFAIGELLAHRAGVGAGDSGPRVVVKIRDLLRRYWVDGGMPPDQPDTDEMRECAALLLSLPVFRESLRQDECQIDEPVPGWHAMSGFDRTRRVFAAIAKVLRRICAQHPLVLAFRGADYLDRLTFDLLIHLAVELSEFPLLCVMFAREDRLGLNCEQVLALKPLEEHEVRHQLIMLLRGPIADATIRFFASKSGGNAFYVAELARVLLDRGVLQQLGRLWRVPEQFIHAHRDASIHDILGEQLNALPEEALALLAQASICGSTFWAPPIERALGAPIAETLELCLQRRLIVRRPECRYKGISEYAFRQDWMQRRFYESLPEATRRHGHGVVASWLVEVGGESLPEVALVGHHLALAGDEAAAAEMRTRLSDEGAFWEPDDAEDWFAWPEL